MEDEDKTFVERHQSKFILGVGAALAFYFGSSIGQLVHIGINIKNELDLVFRLDPYNRKKTEELINQVNAINYIKDGILLEENKDFAGAETKYSLALDLEPNLIEALMYRGRLYLKERKFDDAIYDFSKGIQIEPQNYLLHYSRGAVHLQQGNLESAVFDFTSAIKINPNDKDSYYALEICLKRGKLEESLKDLNNVKELDGEK